MGKYIVTDKTPNIKEEFRHSCMHNREVRISTLDSVLIFFFSQIWTFENQSSVNRFVCYFCCCTWNKKKELIKMYKDGKGKIEQDIDIIKLIKSIKKLQALAATNIVNSRDVQMQIVHHKTNVIDLDATGESCCGSSLDSIGEQFKQKLNSKMM